MRDESTPVTGPVAVYVLTTEGPVRLERISRESAAASSMVCLRRTSRKFDTLSTAYDDFVRAPTGVIDREFSAASAGAYRLDVSAEITDGDSWQFGVFVAHALHANGRLCGPEHPADVALLLTGSVDADLRVGDVAHVREKLHAANGEIELLAEAGADVRVILPAGDAAGQIIGGTDNVNVERAGSAAEILADLGIQARGLSADPLIPAGGNPPRAEVESRGRKSGRQSRTVALVLGGIIVAGVVGAGVLLTPNRIEQSRTINRAVIPVTPQTSQSESAQEVSRKPQTIPKSPSETATRSVESSKPAADVQTTSAARDSVAEPVPLPSVTVAIVERRAPDGATCANVLFGTAEAAMSNVRKDSATAFAVSQGRGLCGLAFVLTPGEVGGRVQASIEFESGRLIEQGRRPPVWVEGAELTAPVRWYVDLPQRRAETLDYRVTVKSTSNGKDGETKALVSTFRHRVEP